jgi:uncharacterized membrane protein
MSNVFRARPLVAFYFGRITTATAAVVVIGLAMAECSEFIAVIAAIALLPMTLFVFGSYSADAVTIAVGLYTTAVAWRARSEQNQNARTWGRLCAATFILAMCKGVYAPIALLAIRRASWTHNSGKRAHVGLLLASLTLGIALSAITMSQQYRSLRTGGDPAAQVRLLETNPSNFIRAAIDDYWLHRVEYRNEFVGYLGWLDVAPSATLIVITFYLLVGVAVTTDVSVTLSTRAFGLILGLLLCFGVSLSQYVVWTSPGATHIDGIQGRYFLPLALAMLLPFAATIKGRWHAVAARTLYSFSALAINVNALMLINARYY